MIEIFLATTNQNKVKEINEVLDDGFTLKSVFDLSKLDQEKYQVIENGETFSANALLKALALQKITGTTVIAEDTGLCVDALWGQPGIHSARYAKNDKEKVSKLLNQLKNSNIRTARFITSLVYLDQYANPIFFIGRAEGEILEKPIGEHGFGYDPIFYYPPLKKSFAELNKQEKSQVSHRGKAVQLLLNYLNNQRLNR